MTLISAPVSLDTPAGAQRIDVQTAEQMLQAVMAAASQADALLMAAAVADFRPVEQSEHKIKKESGLHGIDLQPTVDILEKRCIAETRRQDTHTCWWALRPNPRP